MAALDDDVRTLTIEEIDMVSGGDLSGQEVKEFFQRLGLALLELLKDWLDDETTPTPPHPPPPRAPPAGA